MRGECPNLGIWHKGTGVVTRINHNGDVWVQMDSKVLFPNYCDGDGAPWPARLLVLDRPLTPFEIDIQAYINEEMEAIRG